MSTSHDKGAKAGDEGGEKGAWVRILTGRLGVYTAILNLGVCLYAIDTFVIATILPTIIEDIGGARYYSWTFLLYMVGSIIGAASTGPVRDIMGRRYAYVAAGLIFVVGNIGAALAPSILALVGWRFIQGLGGGLIISQSYGLVGDIYPPELRTRILSVISTTWGVATVIGPAFGGVFAEFGLWRGAFWGIVPLGLIFSALAWAYITPTKGHGDMSGFPLRRLAILVAGILSAGMMSQFDQAAVMALFGFAAVALTTIAIRLDFRSDTKMFPSQTLKLFTIVGSAYWVLLLITISLIFVTLYATLYLQVLHGYSPIVAAYLHAVLSITWTVASVAVAHLQGRRVWWAVNGGVVCIALGSFGLIFAAVSGPLWMIMVSFTFVGIGIGFSNNHIITKAIASAPPGEEGLIASSVQTMRTMGIAFGSAAAGMVANLAGMIDGKTADIVANAVDWVHRWNGAIAIAAVAAVIVFYRQSRQSRPGEAGRPNVR